jgi:hypothetical protein
MGGRRTSPSVDALQLRTCLLVAQPLKEYGFVRFDFGEKRGEARGRNGGRDVVPAIEGTQLGGDQEQFALRVPMELPIGGGDALAPALVDIRVGPADIKRIVTHGHLRAHHVGEPEDLMPIGQGVHFDALARMHTRSASGGTGQRRQSKRLIIHDPPMSALPTIGQPHSPGITRALSEGGMLGLIVDVVGPLA